MAPNQVCSICNKTFTNYCGLTSHLRLYEPCRTRLLSQIPPIPPVVFNRRIPEAQSPDEVSAGHPRRSGRYSANENTQTMEFDMFPDNDLSDVESEHPVDQIPPLGLPSSPNNPSKNSHLFFRLPSEIVKEVQNSNLDLDDHSDTLMDVDVSRYLHRSLDSSTAFPHSNEPPTPHNEISTPCLPKNHPYYHGYSQGEVSTIAADEDFDMLQAFPSSLISMTRIIKFCRDAGVPLYVVDGFLKIVSEEVACDRLNLFDHPSHATTMKHLSKLFHVPSPHMITIPLERTSSEQAHSIFPRSPIFPQFSFLEQLQDLLSESDLFCDLDNLVVNKDNPWLPYQREDDKIEEMHDGDWFLNSRTADPDPLFFDLGIILYTDKTGVGRLNPHGMEPLVFTLSLFTESVRRKPDSWRPLGFIPQFRKASSALERVQKQSKHTIGRLVRNYHRILDSLLSGFVECQKNPPIVRIRLGNEWKFVMVRLFLEAILGDALSNDVICGRVQNRNGSLRLCRACHIPQGISHDPFYRCIFFVQRHIERIIVAALGPESDPSFPTYGNVWEAFVTEKIRQTGEVRPRHVNSLRNKYDLALRRRKEICSQILHTVLGSHVVDNTFFRTSFGNNPRGIFGATPTDPMHAVEEGMAPMILEVLIDPLPDSAKQKLDEIVESLFSKSSNRSSQRSEYPRISFSGGYSSLTQLSADEKMGKLFALAIVAETPVGREILLQRCDPDFDQKRKERAHRFKKKVNDIPETEPSDDEMDTDDEQEPKDVQLDGTEYEDDEVDPTPVSRQNLVYNPQNDAHNCLVDTQLRLHGLKYFIPMIMQMTELHATKARSIVWNITRSLLKNQNQLSGQISLPNSDDQDVPLEWRHCADRRTVLDSSITSHPEAQFYARNPVEGNTPDNGHAELETPPFSVTCENVDDLIEIIQLFLAFHAFYKYGAPLFGMNGLETIDAKVRQMMEKIRTRLVRGDGKLGWCISKFHDILHMSMDMQLFGCSENSDTSKGEHGLKLWAKLPSRTAQTSHNNLGEVLLENRRYLLTEARQFGG